MRISTDRESLNLRSSAEDESRATQSSEEFGVLGPFTAFAGRVLLVDDSQENLRILTFYLNRHGLTVEVANNGLEAVERASMERFDLIFMDLQMPVLDGYAATRLLRQFGNHQPIVALTAQVVEGDVEKCLTAGCNDFLNKPIHLERFAEILARYLPKSASAFAADSREADGLKGMREAQEVNFAKLVEDYLQTLPIWINELKQAIRAGDYESIPGIAHLLRGNAAMYGFPRLGEIAARIEDQPRKSSQDIERLRELVHTAEELIEREALS